MVDVPERPARRPRVFYGWWVALSGTGLMLYTTGVSFFGFSSFFDAIRADLSWTRAQVSLGPAIQAVQTGVMGPVAGVLADRVGPRIVTATAMFVGGCGFLVLSRVQETWHFYLAFVLLGMMGGVALLLVSTAISNWFIRKRGQALGLAFVGPGFGGILTVLLVALIEAYGWRTTAVITGFGTWAVGIPLALVLRRRPEDYGMLPDGDEISPPATDAEPGMTTIATPSTDASSTAGEVLRTRSYWLYVVAIASQQFAISAFVVHHIPALVSFGFSFRSAGVLVLVFTLASIPMRFYGGYLADRFDRRIVVATMLGSQLTGATLFIFLKGWPTAILFEVIYGTGWGGSNPARLSLQAEYWGRGIFGSLIGVQMAAGAVASLSGPVLIGWLADTESYQLAFVAPIPALMLATALVLLMRRPVVRESQTR